MKVKKIMLFLYLFYILYTPIFFKNTSLLFSNFMISIVLMLLMLIPYILRKDKSILKMILNKKIMILICGIFLSSIYFMIRACLAGITNIMELRIVQNNMLIVYIIHVLIIVDKFKKYGYDCNDAIEFIFKIATVQGIICLLMLIIPSFKEIANMLFLNYAKQFEAGEYILTSRIYGISSDYTFGMPIVHAILSGICYYLALLKDRKYFIYFPFIALVSVLNSRTGVLVLIISVLISTIYYLIKYKKVKEVLKIFCVTVIIISIFVLIISFFNDRIIKFITILFQEIKIFITEGETTGTIDYLLNTHFYLPKGTNLLFGEGHRVYGEIAARYGYTATDVGLVNDLFMGGIIYIVLLYGAFFVFIFTKTEKDYIFPIKLNIFIGLIIANLKGQIFVNNTFIVFILIIMNIYFFIDKKEIED